MTYIFRHKCPCGQRFVVHVLEGESVACPKCNAVCPAVPEPCDEHWWAYFVAQPLNRKMLGLPPLYVAEEAPKPRPVKEPRKIADAGVPL